MFKSIKWRLVTIYVILVIIVMLISGSLIVYITKDNEYDNMRKELISIVDHITQQIDVTKEISYSVDTITETRNLLTNKLLYIFDSYGDIIYPEQEQQPIENFYYSQIMGALYGNKTEVLDSVPVTLDGTTEEYKGYAQSIKNADGDVEYVVYVLASTKTVKEKVQQTIGVIILAMLIAIITAAILGFIFSNYLTKPISILSEKARAMASGDLELSIDTVSDDEIGDLTHDFNSMAVSLKDTLDQISSEKNKLEIVFSHITDGILVFDKMGILTHYNPASIDMLGISTQRTYNDVFSEYADESFSTIYQKVMNETLQHIIKVRSKYYNICLAKFLSQHETLVGIICVIQDITEYKKLEEMQKEFVANVSHELRTPLTTIKSYTETLLDGALYQTEIAENFLGVINNEGDRMTTLVQDLLELSKLDNKQITFKMKELNLNQLLDEGLEKYKIHIDKKEQKLIYNSCDIIYKIIGDANRIEQVIKNIISNAVKYSPEKSTIEVSIYEHEQYVTIEVNDSGLGIPEEDLPRIFDRFYRVDKARSREMGGTGLGLAIAKEIMEYHGGKIEVKSCLGEGSTFFLSFPI